MRKTIITRSKGKTTYDYKKAVLEGIDNMPANTVTITADLNKRSVNMNKFYRFLCNLIANEEGRHHDAVHFDLKCLFLEVVNGVTQIRIEVNFRTYGQMPKSADLIPSTTALSKEEFKSYWQRCAKLGNALHNMNLPLNPHEMGEKDYVNYLASTV